jgi:hypothetical protein
LIEINHFLGKWIFSFNRKIIILSLPYQKSIIIKTDVLLISSPLPSLLLLLLLLPPLKETL